MHAHTHKYIHTYSYKHTHTYTYSCTYINTQIHIHRHIHTYTYTLHTHVPLYTYIHNHTHIYTHVCMHVCTCTHVYIICLYHLGKYIQSLLSHHPFGSCFFPKTTTTAPSITHAHLSICPDTPPLSKWLHLCPPSVTAGWHLSLPWSTENSGSGTHDTWGWHKKARHIHLVVLEPTCHVLGKLRQRHVERPHVDILGDSPAEGPANSWHQHHTWEWCCFQMT